MSSYAMTRLCANDTIIQIKKRLVGAADLSVQKNYVRWSVFCKKKGIEARAMT